MNDPHIVSLTYRLEVGEGLAFKNPPPLEYETDHFRVSLENSTLVVSMKEHHSTIKPAQGRLAPFLRSWELDNELQHGARAMRFVYQTAEVIDRNPPSPGATRTIALQAGLYAIGGMSAKLTVGKTRYPQPPATFVATPDVLTLWNRFQGYRDGREPVSSMGYFCLTVLEARGGGRRRAAQLYQVDFEVLDTLGRLTSDRHDETAGRKFQPSRPPLTAEEASWLEDVVRALIRRVGEHAAGASLRQITMKEFRKL